MGLLRKKQQTSQTTRRRSSGAGSSHVRTRANTDELNERYTFRRNRTLTGSLSSNVVSANETNSELRSKRVQSHDLRRHRRKLSTLLMMVLGVSTVLGFLLYQSIALPRVSVTGLVSSIDQQFYDSKVQEYLAGRPFERFRFSLDVDMLSTYLQTHDAPEVHSVSPTMEFAGLGASTLHIELRKPVVAWKADGANLFVDGEGVAFHRNYYAAPSVAIVDETGIKTEGNKVLASNRFLGFIGRVIGRFHTSGMEVSKVVLPPNTSRQIAVSIGGVTYPVKMSIDRPAGEQTEDAVRAIRYLQARNMSAEYVDVRVSGKAYYK